MWFAIVLGLIQGLTEFLPVSSSGHLALMQMVLGSAMPSEYVLFNVLLHFGTLLAVTVAFWHDIKQLGVELLGWIGDGFCIRGHAYRRFLVLLLLSLVPMFGILPIKSKLEQTFENPVVVGCMLLLTAALLFLSEKAPRRQKDAQTATVLDALLVGVAQCFAVLPGLSRSGTTMCTGLFCGFSRTFALRFAFLMSIPVILGANMLELADALTVPARAAQVPLVCYAAGILTALLSGLAAIKLVALVSKRGNFRPFVVYCTILGTVTLVVSLVRMV